MTGERGLNAMRCVLIFLAVCLAWPDIVVGQGRVCYFRGAELFSNTLDGDDEVLLKSRIAWRDLLEPVIVDGAEYKTQTLGLDHTHLIKVDSSSKTTVVLEGYHLVGRKPLSPSGRRIMVSNCLDASWCVKILDLDSGELKAVGPSGRSGVQDPAWSPDGSTILYHVYDGFGGLHIVDVETDETIELMPGRREAAPHRGAWSPDGSSVIFQVTNWMEDAPPEIHVLSLGETESHFVAIGTFPIWPGNFDSFVRTGVSRTTWAHIKALVGIAANR